MKGNFAIYFGVAAYGISGALHANIIFTQEFTSDPNVSAYYSQDPGPNQWNSILGGTIVNQALSMARSGAQNASFTRAKDFSPAPHALIYKFDIEVSGNQYGSATAASWQVGSGFSASRNDAEVATSVHSRFTVNLNVGTGNYSFRDGADSGTFSGRNTLTWVINNSGATLPYTAPDHTVESVPNDAWDLWVGGTKVFNDRPAVTPDLLMTDLKFAFRTGPGTITMDNFQIESVEAVPESGLAACWALLFLAGMPCLSWVAARVRGRAVGDPGKFRRVLRSSKEAR